MLFLAGCKVEKVDTGPSWNVDMSFPLGEGSTSFYDLLRAALGSDSSRLVQLGQDIYLTGISTSNSDTLFLPIDTLLGLYFVDFNRPKIIKRGSQGLILKDVYSIVRLYLDTVKADVGLSIKLYLNFLESGTADTIAIDTLISANTRYFEYRLDSLYIKAESTLIVFEIYGNSSYVGDVLITDSSIVEVYAPIHLEAHDTLEIDSRFLFISDSVSFGDSNLVSTSLNLFMKRSIPMQFLLDAWLVDTTTYTDSLLIGHMVLNDPPKDALGYSTGFAYDTLTFELDTADINFINQHAGQLRVAIRGILPGDPISPYRAYVKASDSLIIWGFFRINYDIKSGGGR